MAAVAEDLDLLEQSIRKLQIEWEKFFAGIERKPPNELRTRVENLIRRYSYGEIRNNTERFRYLNLQARYNTFNELWNKKLRAIEEGRPLIGLHGRPAALYEAAHPEAFAEPSAEAPAEPETRRPEAPPPRAGEIRVESPELDGEAVRALYESFLDARAKLGEKAAVKYEAFEKLITQQATRILTEKGAHAVDFRLETKEGKVSLKARPVR